MRILPHALLALAICSVSVGHAESTDASAGADDQAVEAWVVSVLEKVRQNWVRPNDAPADFDCQVRLEQTESGEVTSAAVVADCGSKALNESVVSAVRKASPLPTAPAGSFEKVLVIRFCPTIEGC